MVSKLKLELKEELMTVLSDSQVKKKSDLKSLFEKGVVALDEAKTDREVMTLAAQLSQSLSIYLMGHRYEAPKSVVNFGTWLVKYSSLKRGQLAPLQMLAQSLAGSL
ncbi:bacteriocin immunity protein [Streptococcus pluranimalium]|uniref:bacteriocin immunity protein n=1 Tax=Streptococcus pluranimalium TaxID=82348 RepID=UPI002414EDF8|nr:bacteriocin immunity protein [Streptococcus pluranimalium]WFM79272.1 bacteriocin immunity protein [Streptococcus pluranimalium]